MSQTLKLETEHTRDLRFLLVLFVAAIGLYSLDWFNGFWGGVSTAGAERVLSGDMPYRDFWTMYAPGHFYLLALLYRVFGTHFLVEVISASVLCAAAACVCYRLVRNLGWGRIAALVCAGIFFAATYNTGYFKNLGTYPPAILLVFTALNFIALYYKKKTHLSYLVLAGLATGATMVFKHDVGSYTAIATIAGLMAHHLLLKDPSMARAKMGGLVLGAYLAAIVVVILPIFLYFAALAGRDMLQDLIVFSLTDFRFARPEGYPSLLPLGIYNASLVKMLANLSNYLNFTLPFLLFLLGVIATGLAWKERKSDDAALGITFSFGYLLHFAAAHVQINTHIITMSVYGAFLGLMFFAVARRRYPTKSSNFIRLCVFALAAVWISSLGVKPAFVRWKERHVPTTELQLEKVSGIRVSTQEARYLAELSAFVDVHLPRDQKIFVGLHRHDVVVIGDTMLYFILNRPSATRYQELHPAITDTARIQNEIINDLQDKKVSLIVRKHIFSDSTLERVKTNFLRNLPQIGATELDHFISVNYLRVRQFGPYEVWQRKESVGSST